MIQIDKIEPQILMKGQNIVSEEDNFPDFVKIQDENPLPNKIYEFME